MIALSGVARTVGGFYLIIGACAALFALASGATGYVPEADRFAASALAGLFFGGAFMLAGAGDKSRTGPREAVLALIIGWTSTPLFACAPFVNAGGIGVLAGYFDALSALTTTGYPPTALDAGASAPVILWWNVLQWLGGGATIVGAIVILAALNLTGPGVHRSVLFSLDRDNVLRRLPGIARLVFALYGLATLAIWMLATLGGTRAADALCVALASISTGGLVLPSGATTGAGLSGFTIIAVLLGGALGATSFAMHWEALRRSTARAVLSDDEWPVIGAIVVLAGLVVASHPSWDGFSDWRGLAEGASLALTAGWDFGPKGVSTLAGPTVLMFALIGGSAMSTTGGLKVMRVVLLVRHVGGELRRLVHRRSVSSLTYRDSALGLRTMMGPFLYVIGYGLAMTGVALLCAFAGFSLETSVAAAASALGNVGPVLVIAGGEDALAVTGSPLGMSALCIGMVLGRLEVLALFAALSPAFWVR